jgi:hypothetical protein
MAAIRELALADRMATRWRRRRMCVLVADGPAPAALRAIDATGAVVETGLKPALGTTVALRHPEAGEIVGRVDAISTDAVTIGFETGAHSVAFALAAIAADMSRPT